jgi:hypothetical protein
MGITTTPSRNGAHKRPKHCLFRDGITKSTSSFVLNASWSLVLYNFDKAFRAAADQVLRTLEETMLGVTKELKKYGASSRAFGVGKFLPSVAQDSLREMISEVVAKLTATLVLPPTVHLEPSTSTNFRLTLAVVPLAFQPAGSQSLLVRTVMWPQHIRTSRFDCCFEIEALAGSSPVALRFRRHCSGRTTSRNNSPSSPITLLCCGLAARSSITRRLPASFRQQLE